MRHFLTDNRPLVHGQTVDDNNGQLRRASLRGKSMGHILWDLMDHDRPRQVREAVQRGVVCDHPRVKALLNQLVCGVEAILVLGRHIPVQGPTQRNNLGPPSRHLNPLVMIAARRWTVGVQ